MRIFLLAGLALAVTACGGGNSSKANNSATSASNDMMMNQGMTMDANAMGPMSTNGMTNTGMTGSTGMNGAADANTQNMMAKDLKTNDPDTNLANGM